MFCHLNFGFHLNFELSHLTLNLVCEFCLPTIFREEAPTFSLISESLPSHHPVSNPFSFLYPGLIQGIDIIKTPGEDRLNLKEIKELA